MFEDATFHSCSALPNQTPKWMLLALAVNLTVLSALIALPLLYPEGLPIRLLQRALYAPAPPLAAQPQPRANQPAAAQNVDVSQSFRAADQCSYFDFHGPRIVRHQRGSSTEFRRTGFPAAWTIPHRSFPPIRPRLCIHHSRSG